MGGLVNMHVYGCGAYEKSKAGLRRYPVLYVYTGGMCQRATVLVSQIIEEVTYYITRADYSSSIVW